MLVFGGGAPQNTNEFWSFDGNTWTQIQGLAPTARVDAGMCFDHARGVAVLFGGYGGNGEFDDTYEWNGTMWSLRTPLHRPAARRAMALGYDPDRRRSVLFGGFYSSGNSRGDTWEWDGNDWQQQAPTHSPAARGGARVAFDPINHGMLLFGGHANGPTYDDTWRWDGVDWQQLQPPTLPFPRAFHGMVADIARQRVVVLGSHQDPFAWEWDGASWQLQLMASPSARSAHCLVYATDRREVWLFGGSPGFPANDTWVYRTDQPAEYTPFGSGCAGSMGTPQLDHAQYSLPWLGDRFTTELSSAAANRGVLLVTGFTTPPPISLAPFGMPGCDWYVSNDSASFRISDAAGTASWTLPLPNMPALAGAMLHQQAFALDAVNAAGAVVSNAAHLRAGVR